MAHFHDLTGSEAINAPPVVRRIRFADLQDALAKGIDDFKAMPSHALFLCVIYPVIGMVLGRRHVRLWTDTARSIRWWRALRCSGRSRRSDSMISAGGASLACPRTSSRSFEIIHLPSFGAIVALGLLLMAIFLLWLAVAHWIYVANIGYARRYPRSTSSRARS